MTTPDTTVSADNPRDVTLGVKEEIRRAMPRLPLRSTSHIEEASAGVGSGALPLDVAEQMPIVPNVPVLARPGRGRFVLLGEFRGVVVEVLDDGFWARWRNVATEESEEGEFPLVEVSPADRSLVREGAEFYWYIGFADSPAGTRSRQSILRFRRMPSLTSVERANAERRADHLMALLGDGTDR